MTPARTDGGRLGVYVDDVYRVVRDGERSSISTDRAFLLFVHEVGSHFDGLVLFGRAAESSAPADYVLPADVELVALPHYVSLAHVAAVLRATLGTVRCMWRGLDGVERVWVFGPHPFALVLVLLAALRRRRVFLGVRQDTLEYFRRRGRGRARGLLWGVHAMDWLFRRLARRLPTTAVGTALSRQYEGGSAPVLPMTVSLVRRSDVRVASSRSWDGPIRLLTVGRIEPEKNPTLLVRALASLEEAEPGGFRLTWIGRGALEPVVRRLASELGVADFLEIVGYVPFGPDLLRAYADVHLFVHVSLTEGVPQVLVEALATGTPVVATDVGGVGGLLENGRLALLVPPDDLDALASAILRVRADEPLRMRLVSEGLAFARAHTLEEEASRVARFLGADGECEAVAAPERAQAPAEEAGPEAQVERRERCDDSR